MAGGSRGPGWWPCRAVEVQARPVVSHHRPRALRSPAGAGAGFEGWDRTLSPAGLPGVSGSPLLRGVSLGARQRCQVSPVPPQLQLSPVDLSDLHADLKIQERDEFAWKKLKAEGLDEDGEKEAKLIRNLNGTLLPPHPGLRSPLSLWADGGPCRREPGSFSGSQGLVTGGDIQVSVTWPEELVARWGDLLQLRGGLDRV